MYNIKKGAKWIAFKIGSPLLLLGYILKRSWKQIEAKDYTKTKERAEKYGGLAISFIAMIVILGSSGLILGFNGSYILGPFYLILCGVGLILVRIFIGIIKASLAFAFLCFKLAKYATVDPAFKIVTGTAEMTKDAVVWPFVKVLGITTDTLKILVRLPLVIFGKSPEEIEKIFETDNKSKKTFYFKGAFDDLDYEVSSLQRKSEIMAEKVSVYFQTALAWLCFMGAFIYFIRPNGRHFTKSYLFYDTIMRIFGLIANNDVFLVAFFILSIYAYAHLNRKILNSKGL